MIKITIPNNNIEERKYILDIFFDEFLGLDFELVINNECRDWKIELENGNKLIVEDHFFNKYQKDLEYLKLENIPTEVEFAQNEFTSEKDIPIIYGNTKLETNNEELKTIICGIDIFASSFFMLTRWEEHVNKNRDSHDRFPATESLAYKNSFLDRPVVNEYVEMLWNMLVELGYKEKRQEREFKIVPTHDVDNAFYWKTNKFILRTLAGDILKRKSPKVLLANLLSVVKIKLGLEKDIFDTYDLLMDISEKANTKSYFFFMCGGNSKYDNGYSIYDKKVQKLISHIKQRGHYIGIHPSYNTFNDKDMLKNEVQKLSHAASADIVYGRHHVLRYDVSLTPSIWENANMKWDSTLGYADSNGFRVGTCYEYSMFDFINRKKLDLKQKPLIYMEVTDFKYLNLSIDDSKEKTINLLNKVKKYNGEFVSLWHNSNINRKEWKENFDLLYLEVLK